MPDAVRNKADELLKQARSKTSRRIIQDADLPSAFGIDMADLPVPSARTAKQRSGPGKKAARIAAHAVTRKPVPAKKKSDIQTLSRSLYVKGKRD